MKRGLVIQGPLVSTGRGGGAGVGTTTYDCLANIERIVSEYSDFFDEIVVSTWKTSPTECLEKLKNLGVKIVLSDDSNLDHVSGDNRLRQHHTTLIGLKTLSQEIVTACKVRTDQFFNIRGFFDEFETANERFRDYEALDRRGYIQGLFLQLDKPFGLCDFTLVGHLSDLTEFYEAQFLSDPTPRETFNDWPEGSATKKYLWHSLGSSLSRPAQAYSPPLPKDLRSWRSASARKLLDERVYRVWEIALRAVFTVASPEITSSLEWRGTKFCLSTEAVGFRQEWMQARLDFPAVADGAGLQRFSLTVPWLWRLYESGKTGRLLFLFGQNLQRLLFRTRMAGVMQKNPKLGERPWAITLRHQKNPWEPPVKGVVKRFA